MSNKRKSTLLCKVGENLSELKKMPALQDYIKFRNNTAYSEKFTWNDEDAYIKISERNSGPCRVVEITLVKEKENSEKNATNYLEEKRSVFENEVIDEVFRDSVDRQLSVNQGRPPKESKLECELDRNSFVVKLRGVGISLVDF